MALIIPPGYLQAVYEFSRAGDTEPMVITLGHEIDGASGANGPDAPDDLFGAFATTMMPGASSPTTLEGVTVYVGQDAAAPLIYTSGATAVSGPNTNSLTPQNTALLIRKRTDLAGRRGRGRMYFPEVAESIVDNVGTVDASSVAAWQARADDWYEYLTALVGGRLYPPVVLHRSEGIGEEPLPTPVTMFTVDGRVATQRRRLRP